MKNQKLSHPSCKKAVCGVSGTGKTTFFCEMVEKERARWKFVFDHQGELARRLGVQPVFTVQQLAEATARATPKRPWVCFDPSEMFAADFQAGGLFFADYVATVGESVPGRKLFIIDEIQELYFQEFPDELAVLFNVGRRREIDIFFICQSPNQLHNMLRNQVTEFWTFRQTDKRATEWFVEQGLDHEKINSLPEFRWFTKNCKTGKIGEGGGKV